jgi:hypothetical protein
MHPIAESHPLKNGTVKRTEFSDYRNIGGMPLPFRMVSYSRRRTGKSHPTQSGGTQLRRAFQTI